MFHLAAYSEEAAIAAVNQDIAAAIDGEFTVRNEHLIFTEPINLIGIKAMGVGMSNPRFNVPTLNAIARPMIFPFDVSATVPSPQTLIDLRDYPMPMPMNEDIAIESSNTDAAAQQASFFLGLSPPGWNRNLPRGLARLTVRATAAVTDVAFAWSTEGNLTFIENLKGGWYSVVGCYVIEPDLQAFRIVFPNGNIYNQRRMRPGGIGIEALGDLPATLFNSDTGEWGRFHSFEPPRLQLFSGVAGASTQEVLLDLIFLGEAGPRV